MELLYNLPNLVLLNGEGKRDHFSNRNRLRIKKPFKDILVFKGSSIFPSLLRAYKTYAGRRGSKADVSFFQNLKMTILFQHNYNFIAFLFVRFWEEGGDLQKEYILFA